MAAFLARNSNKAGLPADASERDRWIHRDKLTQIEIQEYRDLGLEPPAELLRRAAESRAQAASREQAAALRDIRSPSPYRYDENEEDELEEGARPQSQRQRHQRQHQQQISEDLTQYHSGGSFEHHGLAAAAAAAAADDEGDEDDDSGSVFVPVDPRSPEEIAADPYEDGRATPSLRKSNSKIPLAPYSPVPVPQEHLDRDYPLPRKRGASAGYDEIAGSPGSLAYPKTRVRKGSSSSEGMADEEQPVASSPITGPLTPSSPNKRPAPKNRSASSKSNTSKKKPAGNQRSASNTPRARSNSNTPSRPGTSSGDRPRTATRSGPESDPPWLALMNQYKPDPRLPPDQQMLPTHAKRMMIEQMEREGKPGQVYDQEFNAVQSFADTDRDKAAAEARAQAGEEIDRGTSPSVGDRSARWPLSTDFSVRDPMPSPSPTKANGSPTKGSPGAAGGPGSTPRMTDSPKPQIGLFPSPRIGGGEIPMPEPSPRQPSPRQSPLPPAPDMRAQAGAAGWDEEKQQQQQQPEEKKKGGCGCCVVM